MEGFIIGGEKTKIQQYPHSVYLTMNCDMSFVCAGSVLTQEIILTAAHCLEECRGKSRDSVEVKYGHESIVSMKSTMMKSFIIHEKYDEMTVHNDICLVSTNKPIALGYFVKRVVIMRKPKVSKWAYLAGWGGINLNHDLSTVLMHTAQQVQTPNVCRLLGKIPNGSFCAGPANEKGMPDWGDSGSALVISNYVQIGIVSYKIQRYALVVYTNVSYYYNWIVDSAVNLVCRKRNGG
ncbi:mast cell protease 3-like [Achroia grisella]|uniref:mast cell protease 3-like n=1 Tax=Achroia grisella TaxID=688607 RepID=UPI0027D2E618|nr:mast cell protease 3-like [Achroia grisella]